MKHKENESIIKFFQKQIKKLKKSENRLEANHKKLKNEINGKDREIKQKNDLLDRIFSSTHILIAYLDKYFNFVQVNSAYAKYNKKKIDYFTGKNYFEFYPDAEYKKLFSGVIRTGMPHIAYEEKFNYKRTQEKNTDTYWDWSVHPVRDNDKKINGVILTMLDVTERVSAREDLENANEQLIQSKRLSDLGLLAAAVAHELRNPLSVIQAALYNIERKKGSAPIESQMDTIEKKIMESEQIISNLLTYAKIKMPDFKKVDILSLIDESIDMIKLMFPAENIQINKIISKKFKNIIELDPFQMKKVLDNILVNSLQSINRRKGIIDIHAETVNELMKLTVTDNGVGIKKADLSNVFEPFFTRKSRGTGLGLSICKEIINLHNGNIKINSRRGKGTTVIINIPYRN